MSNDKSELANNWVEYAKASLETRIADTAKSTRQVLQAVQIIAEQMDDKKESEAFLSIKGDKATSDELISVLQGILSQLDKKSDLAQLIAPLFMALQFEDRTRQKLEGLLGIFGVWSEVRDVEYSDHEIAEKIMQHIATMEQQTILSQYFPEHIKVEDENLDDISFF
ncbi:MAG: hypothetical protein ISR69_00570 [Gammaproteobacteria bacterium]|nr:hypothetical protein [Gammaproteobacteria bacterium]